MTTTLAEVCSITMGQAPPGDSYNDRSEGIPLIAGAGDFAGTRIAPKKYTNAPGKLAAAGDIILSIRASIGAKVLSDSEYCLGRGVAGLRPKAALDSGYLWHWLTHYEKALAAKGRGATFLQVNRGDIGEMPIDLPPLPEQRRIAAILDHADALRAKRRQVLTHLDELEQSIFLSMFGHDRDLSSVSDLCDLVVDCVNRTAPTVDEVTPYKMLRTTNVRDGVVDTTNVRYATADVFERWNRRATPQRGDVLLTREAPVGEAGVLLSNDRVFLGQRLMLYRVNPERMTADYLAACFRSPILQAQFSRLGSGSTVKHLPLPACRSFHIPVAPIEDQRRFSDRVSTINDLRQVIRSQTSSETSLFASLQSRAFRGEL